MQAHLPGIDYGCMDTASAPPASVSMATSVPRCCQRSRVWSRSSRARVTVLTGLLDRSALYGVLAEIETLGLDFTEVRQLTPERESPQPGDNRSPRCNLTSGPTNPCDKRQRCTEPRAWNSEIAADGSRW